MSPKITSKSLSYDASLPPFLQRLRAENVGASTAAPRAKRAPNPDADEEDEPVYVDEEGGALDDAELRSLGVTKKGDEKGEEATEGAKPGAVPEPERKEEKIAAIGATRKRKVGKVVGAPEEEEGKGSDAAAAVTEKDRGKPPQKKKKAKKVKLSFGDDE
ncbi:hypothetical protein V494_04135 [Pseudogymnoascus sp. VKM F-4513 (FW-928)]|nr:hypothetical protein V494_04135 [Pseudogymnoascus sp. VKM F-4513 (FW-928)]